MYRQKLYYEALGEWIKTSTLRHKDVAEFADVKLHQLRLYCRGKVIPKRKPFLRLCRTLGLDPDSAVLVCANIPLSYAESPIEVAQELTDGDTVAAFQLLYDDMAQTQRVTQPDVLHRPVMQQREPREPKPKKLVKANPAVMEKLLSNRN